MGQATCGGKLSCETFCTQRSRGPGVLREEHVVVMKGKQRLARLSDVLGDHHSDTLTCMSNLAPLLRATGQVDEADLLYRRILTSREAELGTGHPETIQSTCDLAMFLHNQGRLDEAEPLYRRALQEREALMGAEHPDTLSSAADLAKVLHAQGKLEQAEHLYRRILLSDEAQLGGSEDPDTLEHVSNLANILEAQGKLEEAEFLYHRLALILKAQGCSQMMVEESCRSVLREEGWVPDDTNGPAVDSDRDAPGHDAGCARA
mmetsp:Transcript_126778/g.358668  ORF Transcript_126778/g.358668 Transcript_126778/m.358668 type:complete len:262 (+) Transcript_126778:114-899(+)